ncbi:facilitated trehalose transporter Tret1-2 homolog [Drosophila novamexicana]|uniref:facilitated trehalose transporter Tret1-2 homolog n=1 Tax=Drosophila novamexicana TaxID=47314 RepID=UPI0011E5C75D|nr:facilitated trehalose transporter Tret1-2 homolog [Drosophila novamexicana]
MGVIKQFLAGLAAAFGAFCLGASIGWSGPMEQPVTSGAAYKFGTSSDEWSWISSMLNFGAACMCVPVGILIGAFGRRLIMLIITIPYFLGWGCIIGAQKTFMLYIGRFVVGACGGAFCVMAPVYTTEIAEIRLRGVMGCFFQLLIVHGILYGFIVGAYCEPFLVNVLCGILPLVFLVLFFWMPESPVFLLQKGKTEQAEKALKWLRGGDADVSGDMATMAADSKKEKATFVQALSKKVTWKGLGIAMTLMLLQQFTGINAILFYVNAIFEKAGTGLSPNTCSILVGVVQVFATIVAILLVERAGRKLLLLVSAIVMGVTTLVMGVYFQWLKDSNVGWLPILAICLFMVGFSLGFGPVPWVVMAELFAEDVKPVCGAIVGTSSWLFAFAVTKLFPLVLDQFGPVVTFWVFTVFSILACIFVAFFVPETKGKTIDEIQGILGA